MKRLRINYLLALTLVITFGACEESPSYPGSTNPPNILFILSDDQRHDDLGITGNSVLKTPNLDQLAEEGIRFNNVFVTTAICSSSRASILTGQHMSRHGIRDFQNPLTAAALDKSFPVLLRKAGYRTGFLGKYAIGSPDGTSHDTALPADRFDYWFGFPQNFSYRQEMDGVTTHLTRLLADKAIEFMRESASEQPFYLSINFKAPHGPRDFFDPALPDWYAEVEIPLPENFTEDIYKSQPEFLKGSLNGISHPDKLGFIRERTRESYRLITGMDVAVGRILKALDNLGLRENTIVLFSSDNGSLRGNHALKGKWIPYEESIRVPLIIRDPRTPIGFRGSTRDEMVLNIDLAPTILAMSGLEAPPHMQGRDIAPLLMGHEVPWRIEWYYEHTFSKLPEYRIAKSEAVRSNDWKYIRYGETVPPYEQLFDLLADPHENHNLVVSVQYQEILQHMRARLAHLRDTVR